MFQYTSCFYVVSLAAVFSVVTQRSGEERCVTTLKTAARETSFYGKMCIITFLHNNIIPTGVIMEHFSTRARPCIHSITCVSQMAKACARYVIKNFYRETTP